LADETIIKSRPYPHICLVESNIPYTISLTDYENEFYISDRTINFIAISGIDRNGTFTHVAYDVTFRLESINCVFIEYLRDNTVTSADTYARISSSDNKLFYCNELIWTNSFNSQYSKITSAATFASYLYSIHLSNVTPKIKSIAIIDLRIHYVILYNITMYDSNIDDHFISIINFIPSINSGIQLIPIHAILSNIDIQRTICTSALIGLYPDNYGQMTIINSSFINNTQILTSHPYYEHDQVLIFIDQPIQFMSNITIQFNIFHENHVSYFNSSIFIENQKYSLLQIHTVINSQYPIPKHINKLIGTNLIFLNNQIGCNYGVDNQLMLPINITLTRNYMKLFEPISLYNVTNYLTAEKNIWLHPICANQHQPPTNQCTDLNEVSYLGLIKCQPVNKNF
jgi:hypothetical protein